MAADISKIYFKRAKMDVGSLHILDYLIFSVLLCVSLGVGIYYAWKEKNQSADSFLLTWFLKFFLNNFQKELSLDIRIKLRKKFFGKIS